MVKLDLQYYGSCREQETEGPAVHMPGRFIGKHSPEADTPPKAGLNPTKICRRQSG